MAITVVSPPPGSLAGPAELANSVNLRDCRFFRWTLTIGLNGDTFDTKLPGIVEVALCGPRDFAGYPVGGASLPSTFLSACRVSAISASGVLTFATTGTPTVDLLVWAK